MSYTINQLATLAGVSVRTLHHYDAIGLLSPARDERNDYRQYGEPELLTLQQILFFRELDFPLDEIKRILSNPTFDMRRALADQRALIELKSKRLKNLIKTIDDTLNKLTKQTAMDDDKLYDAFSTDEADQYAEEAKQRWGHTDAYKQSQERVAKMTKEDMARIKADGESLIQEIVAARDYGAASPEVQQLIARHYEALRAFYEPTLEMYRGLGNMYAEDPRFASYYDAFAPGLAAFMRDAINAFCDKNAK